MDPKIRKLQILESAIKLSCQTGYQNITFQLVAEDLQVVPSFVVHYFKTIKNLKNKILREAIRKENYLIIAQGISCKDPIMKNIPNKLKQEAVQYLQITQ